MDTETAGSALADASVALPLHPDELTPTWLTRALRAGGHDVSVAEALVAPIGAERGFSGQIFRVELSYEGSPQGSPPSSVVAKLPAADKAARAYSAGLWVDRREVEFYRVFAEEAPVRTPECYFSALDEAGNAALLIEDLSDATAVPPRVDCSTSQARRVVEAAARLHARFWDDPRFPEMEVLGGRLDGSFALTSKLVEHNWPGFVRYADRHLPAALASRATDLAARIASLPQRIRSGRSTLAHGDLWLGNVLFDSAEEAVLLDWGALAWSVGVSDIAMFLGAGLSTEMRRAVEPGLLDLYHRELERCGVRDYARSELDADYRLSLLGAFAMPVMESGGPEAQPGGLDIATEDGSMIERIAAANARRLLVAIDDHAAL